MREPILNPIERRDSMDLMLLFDMDRIIQHKVVEEVLNLVFDRKYSIDSSLLDISSLWHVFSVGIWSLSNFVFQAICRWVFCRCTYKTTYDMYFTY